MADKILRPTDSAGDLILQDPAGTERLKVDNAGVITADNLSADVISEATAAAGVTVDGVLLKDGQIAPSTMFNIVSLSGSSTGGVWVNAFTVPQANGIWLFTATYGGTNTTCGAVIYTSSAGFGTRVFLQAVNGNVRVANTFDIQIQQNDSGSNLGFSGQAIRLV